LPSTRLYPSLALHAKLAHEIGRRIITGVHAEGASLPRESALTEEFGVSRQAVREALKVLAAKGLVASRRRTGTSVLPRASWNLLDPDVLAWHTPESIRKEFLDDLIELRRAVEPAAAELAARRADPERVGRIKKALDGMRENAANTVEFLQADAEFHTSLLTASGNSLFERLSTIIGPVLEMAFKVQAKEIWRFKFAIEQHAAVYDAIARGDPKTAHDTMEEIVSTARDTISRIMHERDQPRPS
jgi:GntR family transcriptional regulator, galactonate operon transcriptional repressor